MMPSRPIPVFQQAVLAYRQGRLDEAETLCRAALKHDPRNVGALHLQGVLLLRLAKPAAAIRAFDRLLELKPASPDVLSNRAMALEDLGRLKEAMAGYDRALKLKPDYAEALNNRANLLFSLRRFEEAADAYARLRQLTPANAAVLGSLHRSRMSACDWTDFHQLAAEIEARIAKGEPADEPLSFTWHCASAALQRRCAEIYAARTCPAPARALLSPSPGVHDRIRLAYLSGDLREHAVAHSFAGLFERLDRRRFELIAISFGENDGSVMRARMERAFDRFLDVRGMDDLKVARLMREAGIDIAVDIAGYTVNHRAPVLALRPAPIQVLQQGFPATMGAPFIDYIVADREVIPPSLEAAYSEKVVRLPGSFLISDDSQPPAGPPPSRAAAGLPDQGFVFCSFNNSYKITPPVFDVWMRLLRAVDGSVLWLRHESPSVDGRLCREAEARGVAADRLVFARRVDLADHLARHRLADLFVDSFPYSAHSTGAHALWAGVPMLTLRGESFASRVAASLLVTSGLGELVTDTLADYEARALQLAREPRRLTELRARLEAGRATSPLFDTAGYCRNLEAAFSIMHQRHRRGDAPASFDVPAVQPTEA